MAGFSVVAKKQTSTDYVPLRKLLMCCPSNYAMTCARGRSDLEMHGGSSLATTVIVGKGCSVAGV